MGTGALYRRRVYGPDLDKYGESVAPGFDTVFFGRLLHRSTSAFQAVEVYDNEHFGRMLVLDSLIQTTEQDEFCYHEMLVHPALSSRDEVGSVLVIGGGDGGTLRHVLMHGPAQAVMVEIDKAVTDVSLELLPSVADGALDDPRTEVLFDDGAAYVARSSDRFDAIVIDSTDPIGAAEILFSPGFYADCARALRPGGVIVTQSGSPTYQLREMARAGANMRTAFANVEAYIGFVPTYPGVAWTYTVGTDGAPVSSTPADAVASRLERRGITTRMYTPALHAAAFALPAFVAEAVAATEPASVPRG